MLKPFLYASITLTDVHNLLWERAQQDSYKIGYSITIMKEKNFRQMSENSQEVIVCSMHSQT